MSSIWSKSTGLIAILCVVLGTEAGVLRHDRSLSQSTSLAADPAYQAVGLLLSDLDNVRGSGTLIHPRWVLTAAHVGFVPGEDRTFELGSETRTIDVLHRHPNWMGSDSIDGWDLALHRLDTAISGVELAKVYRGSSEVGQLATFVGYGVGGDGLNGPDPTTYPSGAKRAGTNLLSSVGCNAKKCGLAISENVLVVDFDQPGDSQSSVFSPRIPVELEYIIAEGDSGGGVFIEENGEIFLVGAHSFTLDVSGNGIHSSYGDITGSIRVGIAETLIWIDQILPTPGDMDDNGLIDNIDIPLFVSAMAAVDETAFLAVGPSARYYAADVDWNGVLDELDVSGFIDILDMHQVPSASVASVPEPSSAGVLALSLLALFAHRRSTWRSVIREPEVS